VSTAYLSLGSNLDAEHHICAAFRALNSEFAGCRLSPVYRNRAVGFDGDDFINLVAAVETHFSPEDLRHHLRDLEDLFGRDRNKPRFSDRTLDVDILLFDDLVLDGPDLKLPRPEILKFAHVLKPLSDLAPNLVHPVEGKTMAKLWESAGLGDVVLEEIELEFGQRKA
jgi:2-amino-4-hydroxy-6-hydroxymethyldihydropteridine diphosphokinase